jgi:hypothetical protein
LEERLVEMLDLNDQLHVKLEEVKKKLELAEFKARTVFKDSAKLQGKLQASMVAVSSIIHAMEEFDQQRHQASLSHSQHLFRLR